MPLSIRFFVCVCVLGPSTILALFFSIKFESLFIWYKFYERIWSWFLTHYLMKGWRWMPLAAETETRNPKILGKLQDHQISIRTTWTPHPHSQLICSRSSPLQTNLNSPQRYPYCSLFLLIASYIKSINFSHFCGFVLKIVGVLTVMFIDYFEIFKIYSIR